MKSIETRIADELAVQEKQVEAAVRLLDEGATVPFIARYRKEVTGGLDDTQLRALEERLRYLRELDERRVVILKSIEEQGKLTPELQTAIQEADTKTRLEDLYLPFKPKRRTKAQIAREAGLEPLAHDLLADPTLVPEAEAAKYIDPEKKVEDAAAALEGARQILMEEFAEDAELIGKLRETVWENAVLRSKVIEGKEIKGAKFSDYFDYQEDLKKIPSHRALALFRGRNEGVLQLTLSLERDAEAAERKEVALCQEMIARHKGIEDQGRPADAWLRETVRWAWKVRIFNHLDVDLKMRLWKAAEEEAIRVFAHNLRDLLLAAPAGPRPALGLDPGLRTGVKVAALDGTGQLVEKATIYPHEPRNAWDESIATLAEMCRRHRIELISIGNGTASRETDKLVHDLMKRHPELNLTKLVVSEAGASVYSASELAAKEFPDLDVSLRGAVSIGRRLQDPLAELVKIDPKSIGVGQYQHDVSQTLLGRALANVVEDCVNAVGVDVNTASVSLLTYVAGLNQSLARNIVEYRNQNGPFKNRLELKKVPRLGEKTFEQAAGFLRIMNGDNPLDASAVHPEAYPVVERIVAASGKDIRTLIGDTAFLRSLPPEEFADEQFGVPTVKDILAELEKPGRDPRPEFKTAVFQDHIVSMEDLQPGMILEGVVTNVTNFGAFVDVGVHQDGLVHISAMSYQYVRDPRDVVKAGDVVKVKVVGVDLPRKRIALTMRLEDRAEDKRRSSAKSPESASKGSRDSREKQPHPKFKPANAIAEAFAEALKKKKK
ncbi:MAG TPA: Tex family protein [bacterium]|nr:Tex family protein [bacterium]